MWARIASSFYVHLKIIITGTSLAAQWLRIHLPMQGTGVWALVWEDLTYYRATKPMHHNYWACALEPESHNYWAHVPQPLSPCTTTTEAHAPYSPRATTIEPMCHNYWSPRALEPASHNYWACVPQLLKPTHLEPVLCSTRSHRKEKPMHRNEE